MAARKSNIELLRIISMFLIVTFHCIYFGGFSFSSDFGFNEYFMKVLWNAGELGVNIFMLISGYFMVNGSCKIKKVILLMGQVLFYSVFGIILGFTIGFSKGSGITGFLQEVLGGYWFVIVYTIIYLLSSFLNQLAHAMSKASYQKLLLTCLLIWSVAPTVLGVLFDSTETLFHYNRLVWLTVMYFVGGYIRLHGAKIISTMKRSLITAAVPFGVIVVSVFVFEHFRDFFAALGSTEIAYFWAPNSLPLFVMSLGVFGIFSHIDLPSKPFINRIASTTLGIYLLHGGVLNLWLWQTVFKNAAYQDSFTLVPRILAASAIVFVSGVIIDLVRQLLEKYTLQKILNSALADRVSKSVQRFVPQENKN